MMNLGLQAVGAMSFKELNEAIRCEIKMLDTKTFLSGTDAEALVELNKAIDLLAEKIPSTFSPEPIPPQAPVAPEPCPETLQLNIRDTAGNAPSIIEFYKKINALEVQRASASKRLARRLKYEIEQLMRELPERMIEAELSTRSPEWAARYRTEHANWLRYQEESRLHKRRLQEYRQRMNMYRDDWQVWKESDGKKAEEFHINVRNRRKELEALAEKQAFGLNFRRVPWRILPPGEDLAAHVQSHFEEVRRRNPMKEYDGYRLIYALSLSPRDVAVGEEDFDGYYVFFFRETERVLLENCEKGNAAYILFEDWERLSQLSKQELRDTCRGRHARVCHTEGSDWKWQLRRLLDMQRQHD